ncbi:hypothetical protein HNY73_016634 [Argiope bruennichi]|uniref:Daxx histone-binding domain-containing protein n=1 Tax=Argiope bruennichi TaxID=94029 RepID=A0A8T0EJ36_ARGBR|nr:hypothetical protein HNY73_016634 [Argiope bruennichi]
MGKRKVEVITLLSSDEETPPLVNNLSNKKTDVKVRKTARKSTAASMGQLSITPIKTESKSSVSHDSASSAMKSKPKANQPILNSTSVKQSTFPMKQSVHDSNNLNTFNHNSNLISNLQKNAVASSTNGLPPIEITKKMPHLTITPIPKPSDPPVAHNSKTARKSFNSKPDHHLSPEVQITASKLNKSATYQSSAKFSKRNQSVKVSSSSTKTAIHPSDSNIISSANSSYSDSKSHISANDSLYVESMKKKARKSFPSSNSQIPPSLISSLGKSGVSIINIDNTNSLNSGQVRKKSEEVFDPKNLKTSPDLSITKIKTDKVTISQRDDVESEHVERTQVSQMSLNQNNVRQLRTNSLTNNKNQNSTSVKSKHKDTFNSEFVSHESPKIPFKKVSKNNALTSSVSKKSNNMDSKTNSMLSKPQKTRSSKNNDNSYIKKTSLTGKTKSDSKSDVIILPNTPQMPSANQKPVVSAFAFKSTVSKTSSSINEQNVSQTNNLKKNQPLKRKNSNSVSNPRLPKKVSFEAPQNGEAPNSAFVDHHKRIMAIKESLKDLDSDLKQKEKVEKSLDNVVNVAGTKKDSDIPLQSIGEKKDTIASSNILEKKKDTIIPLPCNKKRDTIISVPCVEEKKKDTVILLPYIEGKKKEKIILLPSVLEKKKDTVISLPNVEVKKKDTVIPLSHIEEMKKDSLISLPNDDDEKGMAIPLASVDEEKEDISNPVLLTEEKDANVPLPPVDESIVKGAQLEAKEHESQNEISNLEELSNDATVDAKHGENILDNKRPLKQVTSPKLSLKRNINTDGTPVKKLKVGSNAVSENICVPLHNQNESAAVLFNSIGSVDVNSFPWSENDNITTKYKKFLQFCKPFMKSSPHEENKIVKTFLKQFQKADVQFIESTNFIELLCETVLKVKTNPGKIFVHLSVLSSKLREHKKLDFSHCLSSSNDRPKSDNHVKPISDSETEVASHSSNNRFQVTESANHFKQIAKESSEITAHVSSEESKVLRNTKPIDKNSFNELERATHASSDYSEKIDSAKHNIYISNILPEITSDLSNSNDPENSRTRKVENRIGQTTGDEPEINSDSVNLNKIKIAECTNHTENIPADEPEISTDFAEPQNEDSSPSLITSDPNESVEPNDSRSSPTIFNPTVIESSIKGSCMNDFYGTPSTSNFKVKNHIGQIAGDEPEINSDSINLNKSKIAECTNHSENIPADEPEISTDFAEPANEDSSPSLITFNPNESVEPNDSRSSPTIFNPTVIESSIKGSCMNDFYSRPSTSRYADYAEMLLSSTLPGNTLEEIERESYRLPLDSATKDSIENHQDFLISKKISNSIPHSELPIPVVNPDLRNSLLDKGNDSDSTASFPSKSNKYVPKKESVPKNKKSDEEEFEKRIRDLEKYLGRLSKKIKKLQLKELSLDDLDNEDSVYILQDNYINSKNVIISEQIFKDIGKELQRRRILDMEQDLISYCPEDAELDYDPADHDESLKSKLISSVAEGEKKMDEIMQKYAEMQKEEEVVHDGVMEVEETSEEEREDSDIPETEPATPSTDERMDEIETERDPPKQDYLTSSLKGFPDDRYLTGFFSMLHKGASGQERKSKGNLFE